MKKKEQEDLKLIREMMEKSTKFLSLSGLSGITAGTTALISSVVSFFILKYAPYADLRFWLLVNGLFTLAIASGFGLHFSLVLAEKKKRPFLTPATKRAAYHMAIPLFAGGVTAAVLMWHFETELVAGTTLVFYGLGLVNASKFTMDEIHYLGLIEVALGLLALVVTDLGLVSWALGFGVCHILYGIKMYRKYESN